nr:glycosyltransferase family 4 protein [Desulfobulbaceae bacterium]
MNIIKKSLQTIYDCAPLRAIRSEFRKRLASLLQPVFDQQASLANKVTALQAELNTQKSTVQAAAAEISQLITRSNCQLTALTEINNKSTHILNNHSFQPHQQLIDLLYKPFTGTLNKLFDKAYSVDPTYYPLLFNEIIQNYNFPGGTAQLYQHLHNINLCSPPNIQLHAKQSAIKQGHPLKILIVSGYFPCVEHGGGLRLFDIICALSEKGHEIDIYSHFSPELDTESFKLSEDKLGDYKLVGLDDFKTDTDIQAWLKSINKDENYYDVVQLEYPPAVRLINDMRKFGKKVGYTFMECQTKSYAILLHNIIKSNKFSEIPAQTKIFWNHLTGEKFALDNGDFCIAVTPEDANVLKHLSPRTTDIIPTCISTYGVLNEIDKYSDIKPEENSATFLGYYDHYPNIDGMKWYLKEIHPQIIAKIPDYKIYIIGRGNLTSLMEIAKGDPSVVFTGRVDSIIPHILKSKICVCPLISGAGIRGKINQYSVAGRPTVSTTIGNKGLPYKHAESILIADQPQDFAKEVINLLTDQNLYENLQKNSYQLAIENFTWKKHIETLEAIYSAE